MNKQQLIYCLYVELGLDYDCVVDYVDVCDIEKEDIKSFLEVTR